SYRSLWLRLSMGFSSQHQFEDLRKSARTELAIRALAIGLHARGCNGEAVRYVAGGSTAKEGGAHRGLAWREARAGGEEASFYARRAVTQVPADQAREDRGRAGEAGEAALGDRAMVRAAQHMKAHPARSGREHGNEAVGKPAFLHQPAV